MQQAPNGGYPGLVYFAFDLIELDGEDKTLRRYFGIETTWYLQSQVV